MLIHGITTSTTSPTFVAGFTLYQTFSLFFLFIVAISSIATAITFTSKYFAVKYVSVEDKEALDFSREMRNYFREAVQTHFEENPPWNDIPKLLKIEEDNK